tara:strand:- start:54677 stop:57040 length:2364 start_codon:yes stop_codon:yes gene_type:complete
MRRILLALVIIMIMPQMQVSAEEVPFEFYIDEEVIIHPGETVSYRIAWHNLVGAERHFQIELNQSHPNLTTEGIPDEWTRVASGRLGEFNINITAAPNSDYETLPFSLDITCQEVPEWSETFEIDALVSRWSSLTFGANDGSSFYVQQSVNTSLAVNISNNAGFDDLVKIRMETNSNWEYGFVQDVNGDGEVLLDLSNGEDIFINFWIITPSVQNGAPLAGTGPTFHLEAESNLDRRVSSWTFELEMQTFHNMTIDSTTQNLSIDPGETGRIEVAIRNNGNIDTYLDAYLQLDGVTDDRIEKDGWTVALFNAFEFQALEPNESRIIEIGFDAPNKNIDQLSVELIVSPQAFPQRTNSVSVSSIIDWERGGNLSVTGDMCMSVELNTTCQRMIQIENNGNYYEEYSLHLIDETGMNFEITPDIIGLSKGETSSNIPLNLTPFLNADGYLPASAKLELHRIDGLVIDSLLIESKTAPFVEWVWEETVSSVSNSKLEVAITMRNEGNIVDGLVIRMTSSYYTEMSFVPPTGSVYEEDVENIRSFEIVNCGMGENFTFRAWANIPDDQGSNDDFYLNITAHSRLAEENPFTYSANSSFDAVEKTTEDESTVVNSITTFFATAGSLVWAWKWIFIAAMLSGLMINKSLRDRQIRMEEAALLKPLPKSEDNSGDWMAEFATKKQPVPQPVESPQVSNEAFTGMFKAVSGETKPSLEPVDSGLVGAANTVLDHHDSVATRSKLDGLVSDIASGEINKPHMANVALPDDIVPVTERTVARKKDVPEMLDLDDLDL